VAEQLLAATPPSSFTGVRSHRLARPSYAHAIARSSKAGPLVSATTNPPAFMAAPPLDSATIEGILRCARSNRAAYNKVFTHAPRDELSLLEQGRNAYPRVMKRVKKYEVHGSPVGTVNQDGSLRDGDIQCEGLHRRNAVTLGACRKENVLGCFIPGAFAADQYEYSGCRGTCTCAS
jgi:hypothetical protein